MNNLSNYYKNKKILVLGGAGSIGKEVVKNIFTFKPLYVKVFDNNESGLFDLKGNINSKKIQLIFGDIRDKNRLKEAVKGVQIIFHAASLKHVAICEYNPSEAIKTNVIGTQNLLDSVVEENIEKIIGISTDKAVNPINVLGATKLLLERLFLCSKQGNTIFSIARFGNVLLSRGSVVPIIKNQIKNGGPVTLTNPEMTRFIINMDQVSKFILKVGKLSKGQDIFIPKMPIIRILDLVNILIKKLSSEYNYRYNNIKLLTVGNEYQEKLNEELIADFELPFVQVYEDMYVIKYAHSKLNNTNEKQQIINKMRHKIIFKKLDYDGLNEFLTNEWVNILDDDCC